MRFWSRLGFYVCIGGAAFIVIVFALTGCTAHGCVETWWSR